MLTRLTSLSSRSSLSAALFLLHFFFFFNDTAPTEIYTLSLHDALPICQRGFARRGFPPPQPRCIEAPLRRGAPAPLRHLRTRGKRRDREFARERDGRDEKAVARTHRARRTRSAFLRAPRQTQGLLCRAREVARDAELREREPESGEPHRRSGAG